MNELITALTDAFGHSPFDVTDLLAARVNIRSSKRRWTRLFLIVVTGPVIIVAN